MPGAPHIPRDRRHELRAKAMGRERLGLTVTCELASAAPVWFCSSRHFLSVPAPPSHPGGEVRQSEAGQSTEAIQRISLCCPGGELYLESSGQSLGHLVQMPGEWSWPEIWQEAGTGNHPGASTLS